MDPISNDFQIRNDFFTGNIERTVECERTHFREMSQICTTWGESHSPNSIHLTAAIPQGSNALEQWQNVVSWTFYLFKCFCSETLIKSYGLIFSFVSLCSNRKHVWTKPLFLYVSTYESSQMHAPAWHHFPLWMNKSTLIRNLFIFSTNPTREEPSLIEWWTTPSILMHNTVTRGGNVSRSPPLDKSVNPQVYIYRHSSPLSNRQLKTPILKKDS